MSQFVEFPKMARLNRECIITEKIDGTNAQVFIEPVGVCREFVLAEHAGMTVRAGSRNRWLGADKSLDNMGFASWVLENHVALIEGLGPGRHFGEWWGKGIQRGYGVADKRFSLFNVSRWHLAGHPPMPIPSADPRIVKFTQEAPACVSLVPVLGRGVFDTMEADSALKFLRCGGSVAAPGFMRPEGIVVFHIAGNVGFKATLEKDDEPKSKVKP